jgi:hypothetical protein
LYWPQGWKKDTIKFGKPICKHGASVSAFINIPTSKVLASISNLGPNNKPQMLKVGPKFFQFWLLVKVILKFWKFEHVACIELNFVHIWQYSNVQHSAIYGHLKLQ